MTAPKIDYKTIAVKLVGNDPLAFKAYPDGSLVVIGSCGKKYKFSVEQVQAALPKPGPRKANAKITPTIRSAGFSPPKPNRGSTTKTDNPKSTTAKRQSKPSSNKT